MILEAHATPATEPATASDTPPAASVEAPNGATYGWVMFVAFSAAVVGISFVVCVLALIGSWVMLGVALAVHVTVTAVMMKLVLGAFGSEDHAFPDGHAAEAASRAAIARMKTGTPAATPAVAPGALALEI